MSSDLFITGTDTGVGKTLLSSLLLANLKCKYWKPVQTGACEGTDRETVMKWAEIPAEDTFCEAYIFDPPVSPHLAARQQGITIQLEEIRRPMTPDAIVIEGAGGVLVPINNGASMLDRAGRVTGQAGDQCAALGGDKDIQSRALVIAGQGVHLGADDGQDGHPDAEGEADAQAGGAQQVQERPLSQADGRHPLRPPVTPLGAHRRPLRCRSG